MEIFKTLAEALGEGLTATLVIRNTSGGKMTVVTNFTTASGAVSDALTPFTLKGTPKEMDEGFLEAIAQPVETVKGLVSNLEQFTKAAKAAQTAVKKPSTPAAAVSDAMKKADQERKRREAEAKARKENLDNALAAAREANAHGSYFTAEEFMNLASTLTDDKKLKADLAKQVKALQPQKEGFLCVDDPDTAAKALEEFKAGMVKPETVTEAAPEPAAETPAEPAQDVEETEEESEDNDDEPETAAEAA